MGMPRRMTFFSRNYPVMSSKAAAVSVLGHQGFLLLTDEWDLSKEGHNIVKIMSPP